MTSSWKVKKTQQNTTTKTKNPHPKPTTAQRIPETENSLLIVIKKTAIRKPQIRFISSHKKKSEGIVNRALTINPGAHFNKELGCRSQSIKGEMSCCCMALAQHSVRYRQ